MAQKLEDIKRGGGGSIRVGSTGTISSLMNKELESSSSSSQASSSSKLRKSMDEALGIGTRIPGVGPTTPKRQKQKASLEETGGSSNSSRSPEVKTWKTKIHMRRPHHRIPMLGSEDVALEKTTPKREKPARKVSIVEVVDTNCGIPAGSLSNRLKKLSFSKLSHSII